MQVEREKCFLWSVHLHTDKPMLVGHLAVIASVQCHSSGTLLHLCWDMENRGETKQRPPECLPCHLGCRHSHYIPLLWFDQWTGSAWRQSPSTPFPRSPVKTHTCKHDRLHLNMQITWSWAGLRGQRITSPVSEGCTEAPRREGTEPAPASNTYSLLEQTDSSEVCQGSLKDDVGPNSADCPEIFDRFGL